MCTIIRYNMKPIIDRFLKIAISKKLMVWVTGTVMALVGIKISDNWLILSGIYLGIQGSIDLYSKFKK